MGYGFSTYIFKFPHLSRLYLLSSMMVSFVAVSLWHLLIYWGYRELRVHDLNYRKVLLIGNKYTLPDIIRTVESNKALGLKIVGVVGLEEIHHKEFMGYPHLGGLDSLPGILNAEVVDYAIFTIYRQNPVPIEKAMLACRERGIEVWFKPDFMHFEALASRVDYLDDMPLFVFSLGPRYGFNFLMKRVLDIALSALALMILAVPGAVIASLIKQTTRGPVLFRQERLGLNGRPFTLYKFRTMRHETEERRAEFLLKNEMQGPVFKMRNDPRITPIGRFLRKYSLDELPQLWNVLTGDMSLVGPRPPLPSEVNLYQGWHRRRLSMRPGLTCIWQISGRNRISNFEEWARMDLKYIDEWNLWLDIKILLKTVPEVLKGTGV
jgi:exopolysaccharide biosynthesis polyprenyl glycosylphosphotransferase